MASAKTPQPRITQAECARRMGIPETAMTRRWKPAFEERGLPGFYDDGVDQPEFSAGYVKILQEDATRAGQKSAAKESSYGGDDPDEDLKRNRAMKLSLEIQALRDEMIYIPDLKGEIVSMAVGFVQAQRMLPVNLAAKQLAWMATLLEDDLKESQEVRDAFAKIRTSILERFLDDSLDATLPDLGKALDKAFRNAVTRARIRAS